MEILHLVCLNNDPEIKPYLGPKCVPVFQSVESLITMGMGIGLGITMSIGKGVGMN